jgi:hypothetical protein
MTRIMRIVGKEDIGIGKEAVEVWLAKELSNSSSFFRLNISDSLLLPSIQHQVAPTNSIYDDNKENREEEQCLEASL